MPHFLKSVFTSFRSTNLINKSSTTANKSPSMQLAPSDIHFLAGYNQHCYKPDPNLLNSLTNRLSGQSILKLMNNSNNNHNNNNKSSVTQLNNNDNNNVQVHKLLPNIQVAQRNGAWFSLNNSYLHVFRELERLGKCCQIEVEVVPLSKVPKFVQDSMVVQLPTKPDLIHWDQDDDNNETGGEEEDRPLLVHNKTVSKQITNNNDFQSIKDDLKKKLNSEQPIKSFCWLQDSTDSKKTDKHVDKEEQEMCDLEPTLFAHEGSGKVNKQGYHQLSDGGAGSSPQEESILPFKAGLRVDSETEGASSFSGTDYSDYDLEAAADSDSEYDESLTCNVCDRSFPTDRKLMQHQQRKRHYGCSVCDSIFPNLMTLELHKESLEHWSDGDDGGDVDDDEDDSGSGSQAEELERLL